MQRGSCHHCGRGLEFPEKVFRNDTCPGCGSDLHCCLNCRDYDESASNQCREPQTERNTVKDRRNFCEYFRFREGGATSTAAQKAVDSRRKLEALFKK
ncbi:MAG: hypothetical protein AB1646_18795 [Thermodesulfobacteriota bacterium]